MKRAGGSSWAGRTGRSAARRACSTELGLGGVGWSEPVSNQVESLPPDPSSSSCCSPGAGGRGGPSFGSPGFDVACRVLALFSRAQNTSCPVTVPYSVALTPAFESNPHTGGGVRATGMGSGGGELITPTTTGVLEPQQPAPPPPQQQQQQQLEAQPLAEGVFAAGLHEHEEEAITVDLPFPDDMVLASAEVRTRSDRVKARWSAPAFWRSLGLPGGGLGLR